MESETITCPACKNDSHDEGGKKKHKVIFKVSDFVCPRCHTDIYNLRYYYINGLVDGIFKDVNSGKQPMYEWCREHYGTLYEEMLEAQAMMNRMWREGAPYDADGNLIKKDFNPEHYERFVAATQAYGRAERDIIKAYAEWLPTAEEFKGCAAAYQAAAPKEPVQAAMF